MSSTPDRDPVAADEASSITAKTKRSDHDRPAMTLAEALAQPGGPEYDFDFDPPRWGAVFLLPDLS